MTIRWPSLNVTSPALLTTTVFILQYFQRGILPIFECAQGAINVPFPRALVETTRQCEDSIQLLTTQWVVADVAVRMGKNHYISYRIQPESYSNENETGLSGDLAWSSLYHYIAWLFSTLIFHCVSDCLHASSCTGAILWWEIPYLLPYIELAGQLCMHSLPT